MNKLAKRIHDLAKEKGWYDSVRSPLETHMRIVGEVAEASEEVRNGSESLYYGDDGKPLGELSELADALIFILDYCAYNNWDIEAAVDEKIEYNKTRSYRHGGKKY